MRATGSTAPTSARRVALTTLGEVTLTLDGATPDTAISFGPGKPTALVVYLACTPARSAGREHLLDLLWSEMSREAGLHALRNTVLRLKQVTGDHLVAGSRDTLTLRSPLISDRDAFLAAADRDDIEQAVRLYTGDFFPHFAAPGAAQFEQWADLERQRLRATFTRCADALVRNWLSAARVREAAALARRVRDMAPLQQAGWRLLMETLIAGQDHLALEIEADALDRTLAHEELPLEPSTRSLLRIARRSGTAPGTGADADRDLVADLVGREREFSAIVAAWNDARAGRFAHVHVTAPAGFGKTRLLADAYARLRAMRARVVRVRGSFGARELPYALVSDLAAALAELRGAGGVSDDVGSALVALHPALSAHFRQPPDRAEGSEALRRRTLAVRELILAVAEEAPVAILIDDVQWADAASCALLAGLLGGLSDDHALLIVSAARPYPSARLAASRTAELTLAPLSSADIGGLLASLAAMPDEPWALALPDAMHQATGGSPLLVLETLQLALDQGVLRREGDGWSTPDVNALLGLLRAGGALHRRVTDALTEHPLLVPLLAVAGLPLATDVLARAMDVEPRDVRERLAMLERRGLAVHAEDRWQLAHDEYLTAVLDGATPDTMRLAHAALGRALFWGTGDDARRMRQAAVHLARGGEDRLLQSLFARFVRVSRSTGDGRPHRALASELLGEAADAASAARLVAGLPLHIRVGLGSARRVAVALLAMCLVPAGIVAAVAATRQPPPAPPDARLVVAHADSTGDLLLHEFPLRSADWRAGEPLELHAHGEPRWRLSPSSTQRGGDVLGLAHGYPDDDSWVVAWPVPDSGIVDLFAMGPGGRERRLTAMVGDDVAPEWAPDGSRLAFQAGGFHRLRHSDIAILDPTTLAVRQLTSGDESDTEPRWSPDGTRIAFSRRYWDGRPLDVCVVTVDGSRLRCLRPDTLPLHGMGAWSGDRHVLVTAGPKDAPWLVRLDVETGLHRVIDRTTTAGLTSPDGGWIASAFPRAGHPAGTWFIYPADRPDQARPVHVSGVPASTLRLHWARAPGKARYLDRLELNSGDGGPIRGLPYQLHAAGYDPSGVRVRLNALVWRSLDTLVATVDSTGLLSPRRAGDVTVELSAGGWRTASHTLAVREVPVRTVLIESWRDALEDEWVPFGLTRPSIVRATDGARALWNGNDGSFTSGVYSTRTYSAADGLGMDVRISTRVTLSQWQDQSVALLFDIDSAALNVWDHRTGYPPFSYGHIVRGCRATYPGGGEGHTYAGSFSTGGGSGQPLAAPPELRTGRWFTLRIQVFPDGRCGFALNGRPLEIGPRQALAGTRARVVLDGKSYNTRILVGRVELFTGVKPDIDWGALLRPDGGGAVAAGGGG